MPVSFERREYGNSSACTATGNSFLGPFFVLCSLYERGRRFRRANFVFHVHSRWFFRVTRVWEAHGTLAYIFNFSGPSNVPHAAGRRNARVCVTKFIFVSNAHCSYTGGHRGGFYVFIAARRKNEI